MIASEMTPLFPTPHKELEEMALDVIKGSSRLVGRLPDQTAFELRRLLRNVNSYYSNLIEGAYTHLKDIERAVNNDFDKDERKQKLQRLHRAHVVAQEAMEKLLPEMDEGDLTSPEIVASLHARLFDGVPEEYLIQQTKDGQVQIQMVPGEFRKDDVVVASHVPVPSERVYPCMESFHSAYSLKTLSPHKRIIAAAASHHRLLWIHPFLEGNGRVARMLTDLYLTKGRLDGYGLWTMSRGLALQEKEYKSKLAQADAKRMGDYDGRGVLSDRALSSFCRFFLEVALDQISFMQDLLSLNALHRNVAFYMNQRIQGHLSGQPALPKEAGRLYEHVFNHGIIAKGDVSQLLNVSIRKARDVSKALEAEGLLLDDGSHKSPYRVGLTANIAETIFPRLFQD